MKYIKIVLVIFILSIITGCIPGSDTYNDGPSNLKISNEFGNNKVFQSGKEISIWGTAYKTTKIKVEFNSVAKDIKADKKGNWIVKFPASKKGGPYIIKVSTNDTTVVFKNIFIVAD